MKVLFAALAAIMLWDSAIYAEERLPILRFPSNAPDELPIKWGGEIGTPARVTWGLVERRTEFTPNFGTKCREMVPLQLKNVSPEMLLESVENSTKAWNRQFGIELVPVNPSEMPDIQIGAQAEPDNVGWTALRVDPIPRNGAHRIRRVAICLDAKRTWIVGEGSGNGKGKDNRLSIEHAIMHEVGHAIGFGHPIEPGSIMGYALPGTNDFTPLIGQAGTYLYGPATQMVAGK